MLGIPLFAVALQCIVNIYNVRVWRIIALHRQAEKACYSTLQALIIRPIIQYALCFLVYLLDKHGFIL